MFPIVHELLSMLSNAAWAYLVVSSGEQADSLPNQRTWAEKCAASRGWTITNYFDGVGTGKYGPRKKYDEMRAALRRLQPAERPEVILLIRLDRIGRGQNLGEMQMALFELHELGVKVFTREGGLERQDDVMAQLITSVKLAAGAQENAVKRDKASQYFERAREAAKTDPRVRTSSKPPLGVRCVTPVIGQPGYYAPSNDAPIVQRMFELRAKRVGPAEIARRITTEFGLPPRRNGNYSAKRWHADTVSKMLTARVYVQAGVVSQKLFDQANARLDRRGGPRTKVHSYPLSGALRCPCGSRIHGARGGTKQYGFALYYVCANRNKAHEPNPFRPAEKMEAQFAAFLHTFAKTPALRALVADRNGDDTRRRAELQATLDAVHRDLATLRRRKERLLQDLEDEDDDAVRRELRKRLSEYARQEATFDRQQREAQDALAILAAQADSTEDRERTIMLADELWAEASPDGRKELATTVAAAMHGPLIVDENGILEADLLAQVATAKRLARRKVVKKA
ncbi:MAG TPA: recombinase family protein [Candidatus Cybelea sp.]|nr:recombinase family protein [Candidatus Cybelea sp.]